MEKQNTQQEIMDACRTFARKLKDGEVYEGDEQGETELETVRYWNATITGTDQKWGLARSFLGKKIFVEEFQEGDIIENVSGSRRWRGHNFYVVKDGKFRLFADGDKDMCGR